MNKTVNTYASEIHISPSHTRPAFFVDLSFGKTIGIGGFSRVSSILEFASAVDSKLEQHSKIYDTSSSSITTDGLDRSDLSTSSGYTSCTSMSKSNPRLYAIKEVLHTLPPEMKLAAQIDLAREATFLKALVHPNIISLHSNGAVPGSKDYFIVVEKLEHDLSFCIKRWSTGLLMNNTKERQFLRETLSMSSGQKKREFKIQRSIERYTVLADVASALQFLHDSDVIFRDIKSGNVGITNDGVAKIFDFGLCIELKEKYRESGTDSFKLSIAGTKRYMAPEVFAGKPYNLSADVFSFATLMWQVLTLSVPYDKMNSDQYERFVYKKNKRLKMKRKWPTEIKDTIQKSWAAEAEKRPSISTVRDTLITQLESSGYCWEGMSSPH